MTSPKVAALHVGVLTRVKDNVLLLWRAMESVLGQSHTDWTHVIINDGLAPSAVERVIEPYRKRYGDRLTLLHEPKIVGPEAIYNKAIAAVRQANYLAIHDDNDSWDHNFLSKALEGLKFQQQFIPAMRGIMTWCTAIHEHMGAERVIEEIEYSYNGFMRSVRMTEIMMKDSVPSIGFLFERAVTDEIGGMDESFAQCGFREFLLRFLSRYEIGVVEEHLARRRFNIGPYPKHVKTLYPRDNRKDLQEAAFHNALLRRDLREGRFGLGSLLAILGAHEPHKIIRKKLSVVAARISTPHRKFRKAIAYYRSRWRSIVSP